MNQWQPMTDEDWEWVNHGTLPNPLTFQSKQTTINTHTLFKEIK